MFTNNKKGEKRMSSTLSKNNIIKTEGINDWGLSYNSDWNRSYKKQMTETRSNFSVYVCPKCNVAYEKTNDQYKKTTSTSYYEDFPTIGLKRKECFRCR